MFVPLIAHRIDLGINLFGARADPSTSGLLRSNLLEDGPTSRRRASSLPGPTALLPPPAPAPGRFFGQIRRAVRPKEAAKHDHFRVHARRSISYPIGHPSKKRCRADHSSPRKTRCRREWNRLSSSVCDALAAFLRFTRNSPPCLHPPFESERQYFLPVGPTATRSCALAAPAPHTRFPLIRDMRDTRCHARNARNALPPDEREERVATIARLLSLPGIDGSSLGATGLMCRSLDANRH